MGRVEGRVLNLDGRDRVMNINFFSFFFHPKNELSFSTWSSCLFLCLDYQCTINHVLLRPLSLSVSVFLYLADSLSLSLSRLVLDSVEVMASAHVSPPWSQEAPGSRAEKEGTSVRGRLPIGAAG